MNISRRAFLKTTGVATLSAATGCLHSPAPDEQILVNDVHTQLNPTLVRSVNAVHSLDDVTRIIRRARREHQCISIAGGRHAAGGQQFASNAELIDTRELRRVLQFDLENGVIEVETGIQWPEFMAFLRNARATTQKHWTIAQKQTGTDRLSVGGALSANAHGRGLGLPPFISHVKSFLLVDANGNCHTCSRQENPGLFRLAIGGYGMFGFIYSATLQLVPLRKVRRIVRLVQMAEVPDAFEELIQKGFLYGDFQFAIDSKSTDFLNRGVLAAYEPVADDVPPSPDPKRLSGDDWKQLIQLAHTDPTPAFNLYAKHYLATTGQVYWSDTQYASDYFEDYHRELDARLGANDPATEVIGELYVPRTSLPAFMDEARQALRQNDAPPLIYGTIRLIDKDNESFLAWARQPYACVIFNLHTPHTPVGKRRTAEAFRLLIDLAIKHDGSFYLTYHRYATQHQVLSCYPQFREFLRLKRELDPKERFQSDWYRHYKSIGDPQIS